MDLDIIIPAYNAHNTIDITLDSIKNQKQKDGIHVYIVNDCSEKDYSSFVEKYSPFFTIQEIKTEENVGPGGARNYGILNSRSPYLMFIDSDDYLCNEDTLSLLYEKIHDTLYDLVVSSFIYERDQQRLIKKNNFVWLHGKMFRREFLEKNHILFNTTRANEDNGFMRLILLLDPKISIIDDITYCYHENENSITRKNNREYKFTGLEGFSYNMCWAMKEAIQRNCDVERIPKTAFNVLTSMYFYYLEFYHTYDVSKILKWSKDILSYYEMFPEYSLDDEQKQFFINQRRNDYQKEDKTIDEFISIDEFIDQIKKDS